MKKFQLFNEWRGFIIYGEDLADAIRRQRKLQRPDKFAYGEKVEEGEIVTIGRIIGYEDTSTATRGDKKYICVVAELDDKRIVSFDAIEKCKISDD